MSRNGESRAWKPSTGGSDDVFMEETGGADNLRYLEYVHTDEETPPARPKSRHERVMDALLQGGRKGVEGFLKKEGASGTAQDGPRSGAAPPAKASAQDGARAAGRAPERSGSTLKDMGFDFLEEFLPKGTAVQAQASFPSEGGREPLRPNLGEKRGISEAGKAAEMRASSFANKGRPGQTPTSGAGVQVSAPPMKKRVDTLQPQSVDDEIQFMGMHKTGSSGAGTSGSQHQVFHLDEEHKGILLELKNTQGKVVKYLKQTADEDTLLAVLPVAGAKTSHFLAFLTNNRENAHPQLPAKCKIYSEFMLLSETQLEKYHLAPLVAPTDQTSGTKPTAPLLTQDDFMTIIRDEALVDRVRCIMLRFLEHVGIEYPDNIGFKVVDYQRLERLNNDDHNQLRMSRMLRLMKIFFGIEAYRLLQFLGSLVYHHEINPDGVIYASQKTVHCWHMNVTKRSAIGL